MLERPEKKHCLAAIDLGSNSFHMLVAQILAKQDCYSLKPLLRYGKKVQLAANMENGALCSLAIQRGLRCLAEFSSHLDGLPSTSVSVVGTNALRSAHNSQLFTEPAEQILGYPIDVISGDREARLVYQGVAHEAKHPGCRQLVIDIGGGSTEVVIGEDRNVLQAESLPMGCVLFQERFFQDGRLDEARFNAAVLAATVILQRHEVRGWQYVTGSSGTIQAVEEVLVALDICDNGIHRADLYKLKQLLLHFTHIDQIRFEGLGEQRRSVFASGLAIVIALFDALQLDYMEVSAAALREGVLHDLLSEKNWMLPSR